ncbi:MAG: aminotransferase class V-fold PLP-dependent enzyme [Verrucomicrobia bacterium]|nr:aminotransferase class V-fold PLP-dependent enzyme [Verrucomicrobiota bacterium]
MRPFLTERWGNPSSSYAFGSQLKSVIEEARSPVAALIGAAVREIVFTSSATESNNTALHAALSADPARRHAA